MNESIEGLGAFIIDAVNGGKLIEPLTTKKIKDFCYENELNYSIRYLNVILANSTSEKHSFTYTKLFTRIGHGQYALRNQYRQ